MTVAPSLRRRAVAWRRFRESRRNRQIATISGHPRALPTDPNTHRPLCRARLAALASVAVLAIAAPAAAGPIANEVAVFSGLDKITAEIEPIEIPIDGAARFGSLEIRPRVCYTRPPTEPPRTTTFVEIDEHELSGEVRRVFTGWMFASSPGLNALEHPVYDVWLKSCKTSSGGKSDAIEQNAP